MIAAAPSRVLLLGRGGRGRASLLEKALASARAFSPFLPPPQLQGLVCVRLAVHQEHSASPAKSPKHSGTARR